MQRREGEERCRQRGGGEVTRGGGGARLRQPGAEVVGAAALQLPRLR